MESSESDCIYSFFRQSIDYELDYCSAEVASTNILSMASVFIVSYNAFCGA